MEVSPQNYDFAGWATRAGLRCSDGRTIMRDAFKHNDGRKVPLVWNHRHTDPYDILGHALLENRNEGVYAYCCFNDTENGQLAKVLVQHGDITALSIYANQLKQQGGNVMHGEIREVSLVHAGANPGAFIESVIRHSDDGEPIVLEDEGVIYTGENFSLYHADNDKKEDNKMPNSNKSGGDKTVQDVIDSMTEEQKNVMYAMIGHALEEAGVGDEEDDDMNHNIFETDDRNPGTVLTHADQEAILKLAKSSSVGSLREAMNIYAEQHLGTLAHGIDADDMELLFPDYKDVHPGAPELIERDQSWIGAVMKKAHKSPTTRIRTRQADARSKELRAKGYNNREEEKALSGNIKLLMRTTDPQTVYRRDEIHNDDVIDITDFDVVAYLKTIMRHNMEEDIALAALVGDGREDTDPDKIHENHVRSIWHDEELYTIHYDIDVEQTREEIQGTNTTAHFGENFIRSEAMTNAALYSREKYKGKGQVDCFIDPHELNVMLLARDMNGRRIYDSKADLAKAWNVGEIHTVEQMAGLTRTTDDGKTKKLLAIFVNMGNYQFGCAKGGELTNHEQFDIDFNKRKYLMETRLSGALTEIYSAIALEEDVTDQQTAD